MQLQEGLLKYFLTMNMQKITFAYNSQSLNAS